MILVGHKCDAQEDRAVSQEEGMALAKQFNDCLFLEASVKIFFIYFFFLSSEMTLKIKTFFFMD